MCHALLNRGVGPGRSIPRPSLFLPSLRSQQTTYRSEPQLPQFCKGWVITGPPRGVVRSIKGDGSGLGDSHCLESNPSSGVSAGERGHCSDIHSYRQFAGGKGHVDEEEGQWGEGSGTGMCKEGPRQGAGSAVCRDQGMNRVVRATFPSPVEKRHQGPGVCEGRGQGGNQPSA